MTIPLFGKLKLFCIVITLTVSACGGGSSSQPLASVPGVIVPLVLDNRSVLTVRLMDTISQAGGAGPLKENRYEGVGFSLNGNPVVIRSLAIYNARTYADLRSAFEAAVNALKPTNPSLTNFVVTLGADFTVFDTLSEKPVTGQSIVLTDTGGGVIARGRGGCYEPEEVLVTPGSTYCEVIYGSSESK